MPLKHKPKRILFATYWWLEDLMRAVAHQAAARGWHLNFQMCLDYHLPESWRGDGIITNLSGDLDELAAFFKRARCPAVSLSQLHPEIDIPRVGMDEAKAGQLAAEHFLDREFRSFAHYTRQPHNRCPEAYASFEKVLSQAGYDDNGLNWQNARGGTRDNWENRQRWLRRELRQLPKPLAVFAREPLSPAEVIEAAIDEGLSVPHDVAVLGVFDIALFQESTTVPVSCVIHDFEEHARLACDLLSRMMDGEAAPPKPLLIPPVGIATRESTDTMAARHPDVRRVVRHMLRHFAEPLTVKDFVEMSSLSQTNLYKAFNEDLGQTPHEMLTRIRVRKAKQMLQETDKKLRAVSEDCGFSDPVNLFRQFKQRLGVTPAEYRKRSPDQSLRSFR
ncbi:MAG: substrate-binding domain-containing protein [Lentisphaeria bacterium]|nr:substrate-binding domain-containing protein [Lentisphaeria bacterium]